MLMMGGGEGGGDAEAMEGDKGCIETDFGIADPRE